ncbi:hypothetical protein BH09SUM1_BH09SUM1_25660 [soil metagenome]
MDEKTVMAAAGDGPETFLYREDFLLFGLLVRHGLCQAEHYSYLVRAQRDQADRPPLMKFLSELGKLPDKSRKDMEELLSILSTPKLRELLPSQMPEINTLVEMAKTRHVVKAAPRDTSGEATVLELPEVTRVDGDGATAILSHDGSVSTTNTLSRSLSHEEMKRVEGARKKSRLIGEELAGHVIIDRLGSGGQGDVYLAKQLSLNRYVALKKLEVPRGAPPDQFMQAFRQEAQTLGQINHARIVKVYEIFIEKGSAFFTMEYLNGKTLKDLVSQSGPMPVDVVANLACQACSALSRTASDGLVHRDIKPANMMLDENGDLKIVDFGLSAAAANIGSAEGFSGTPQFASPEQAKLEPLTPRSDQYSLGLTLYTTLTGELPFKAKTMQDMLDAQISETPRPPSEINEQLPRSVDRVIMKMLAKDPAERYATFDECYDDWGKILQGGGRQSVAAPTQLLGESLARFSKAEKSVVTKRAIALGLAWIFLTAGATLGELPMRRRNLDGFLDFCGNAGTSILIFSLCCIFYVALARRKILPTFGSLRMWLYIHIATAIPAVALLLIHSGNFLAGVFGPGQQPKPILSILMAIVLLVTAVSGTVGLMIFRALRRQVQLQQLALRGGGANSKEAVYTVLSARVLAGWRLVHYPLAIFFILLAILHILQSLRFAAH